MYPPPAPGVPTATITIAKSPYLSLGGDTVGFYAFDNELCEDTDASGALGTLLWTTANTISTSVPADTRLFIRAGTIRYVGTGGGMATTTCTNVISLTPETGRTYTLRHVVNPQQESCAVEAVDDATGVPPSSLKRIVLTPGCLTVVLRQR